MSAVEVVGAIFLMLLGFLAALADITSAGIAIADMLQKKA
jgi:hypothetical protein